nr:4662_t:CDS:1 [Entrophospora candida]
MNSSFQIKHRITDDNEVSIDKKRTKNNLSFLEKCRICKELLVKPKPTQEELAAKYNVTQTAISKIFKNKDKYLALDSETTDLNKKRNCQAAFPEIEEAVVIWFPHARISNLTVTNDVLKKKALDFRDLLQINNFTASDAIISHRHNYLHLNLIQYFQL